MENQILSPNLIPTSSPPSIQPTPEPKPKRKLWKRILITFFTTILAITLITYGLPWILSMLFSGDQAPADDSTLRLQKISVNDNQNGFFDLAAIGNDSTQDLYDPDFPTAPANSSKIFSLAYTNFQNPVAWDQKLVDEVLNNPKNQRALKLFDQAANKDYIQIPDYMDPANLGRNLKLYSFNNWRLAGRLQAIKALSLSYEGKADEALLEAAKLNKVGHKIITGQNEIIGTLMGMAIEQQGSEVILQILPYGSAKKETLHEVQQTIKNSSNNIEGYKNAFRTLYTATANQIDTTTKEQIQAQIKLMVDDNSISSGYMFIARYSYYNKPNETKNLYAALYTPQLEAVGKVCDYQGNEAKVQDFDPIWNLIFRKNAIGKLFFSLTGVSLGSAIKKQCQVDFVQNVVQTQLALKQYKIDNGFLPSSLQDLVPQYLESIPEDPYDHQQIRYNPEKKTLYSVG